MSYKIYYALVEKSLSNEEISKIAEEHLQVPVSIKCGSEQCAENVGPTHRC